MQKVTYLLTFTEELLGTKSANSDLFADYIASKHPSGTPQRDELERVEHCEEAGTSVFHREGGSPIVYDYQIKGFFKDACSSLRNADGSLSAKITAYKTKIDGLLFVSPRVLPLRLPPGGIVGLCERPIRAETAQGPRVGLCRSETVPAGTTLEFEVTLLATSIGTKQDKVLCTDLINEWLAYGSFRGLGQWRNSGKGRFTAKVQLGVA